jgi:RNA 2',3'-cyclic 3'-phosphodiesterase
MRLFVAVEIAPAVAVTAAGLIDSLRERALRLAPRSRITWIAADRLHITVRFIGHVDADQADVIRRVLTPSLEREPFPLSIAGVGTFPPKGPPRVVWAGLTEGRQPLTAIEEHVGNRLSGVGIAPDERPYNPHLTLARVREAGGLRSAALLEAVTDAVLGTTTVKAITLFESRLSPKGPTYVALQRTALSGVRV